MTSPATRPSAAGTTARATAVPVTSEVSISHQPLVKLASPKDRCRVLMTNVVGMAEPSANQLKTYQGRATAALVSGATHGRQRRAGVSRYTTATIRPTSSRASTSRPANTPKPTREPRTAWGEAGQQRGDEHHLQPQRRVHERVGEHEGEHGQRPRTGDPDPPGRLCRPHGHRGGQDDDLDPQADLRPQLPSDQLREPRGQREQGDVEREVAVFAVSVAIAPQCRSEARFRTYPRVM
jgi:hypothetical protein